MGLRVSLIIYGVYPYRAVEVPPPPPLPPKLKGTFIFSIDQYTSLLKPMFQDFRVYKESCVMLYQL
jgi:hypothetical protein